MLDKADCLCVNRNRYKGNYRGSYMQKKEVVSVRLSDEEVKMLDARRGDKSRSEYLRSMIISKDNTKEVLSMLANNMYLNRYLCASLGFKELPKEAKKTADEYVNKLLQNN